MGKLSDQLRAALSAHVQSLREVERATGIDIAVLSRFARGQRAYISGAAMDSLAEYLQLALKPARAKRGK